MPLDFGRGHQIAILDVASEHLLGKRVLDIALDHALQRAGAIGRVVALVGEPRARVIVQLQRDLAIRQQLRRRLS
jgi:hypothetical protein